MPKIEATGIKISDETIKKYENILPAELIGIWKEYGCCTMLDGYLRVIAPDDYRELVNDTFYYAENNIPIMVTAFGDVISILLDAEYNIDIVQYRNGSFGAVSDCFDMFFTEDMESKFFQNEIAHFDIPQYKEAVKKLGSPAHDECFGYVPLLELGIVIGGSKNVEYLQKVKTIEHIKMITQLKGKIGTWYI